MLLELRNIHKQFPGVHALQGVTFDVRRGEVHALVGENGAGKSTLMHILAGVYAPDKGEIVFDGRGVKIADERHAQRLGIGIVYQERSLFELLTVAENIFAGGLPANRWGVIDRRQLTDRTRASLAQVGLNLDPSTPVEKLSPAEQQMIEIAKALALEASLLIFDEPTAALTEVETAALVRIIKQLRQRGAGIVYISHRLHEIFEIADRVTVLRDGEHRGTMAVSDTSLDDLVTRMVGRKMQESIYENAAADRVRLEVRHLSTLRLPDGARTPLSDISISARAGEIVGLAGLAGAGRTELALAIFGAGPRDSGDILVDGKRVNVRSPRDAIAAGIGYVPEDRKQAGLFLDMSIADNIAAARLGYFGSWWQRKQQIDAVAADYLNRLKIAAPGVRTTVQQLSGGNQQKVVLSKWLLLNSKVLIINEPTRGIDVGTKGEVHQLLRGLAQQGAAIIAISSDLPEVLAVSDRILVMREGRINGELDRREASEDAIMRYAAGV
jgi:ABC-type sugar transport system ATPase subunit